MQLATFRIPVGIPDGEAQVIWFVNTPSTTARKWRLPASRECAGMQPSCQRFSVFGGGTNVPLPIGGEGEVACIVESLRTTSAQIVKTRASTMITEVVQTVYTATTTSFVEVKSSPARHLVLPTNATIGVDPRMTEPVQNSLTTTPITMVETGTPGESTALPRQPTDTDAGSTARRMTPVLETTSADGVFVSTVTRVRPPTLTTSVTTALISILTVATTVTAHCGGEEI